MGENAHFDSAPQAAGVSFRRLADVDADEVQTFFERCSDFFELTEGTPPRPHAAAEQLTTFAPGKSADDTFAFGVFRSEQLIGFIHLTRDFPMRNEWWLGLMLLEPSLRRSGLGAELHRAIEDWIAANSGQTIWLGVLEQNSAAERFWRRLGYIERERQPYVAPTGFRSTAILMTLEIARR